MGILLVGFVLGWITGMIAVLPLVAALGYCVWLIWRMNAVVAWLQSKPKVATAPPSFGVTDALISGVCRETKYSAKQKDRYKNALKQFNSLAAELPDATIVINQHRQIRWSNPAALSLLAVHPERDRGQRIDNLLRDPAIQAFLSEPTGMSDLEVQSPTVPGRTLSLRMSPAGRDMAVIVARDVTQRARIREMRRGFVADVSHELRTPLTVISGYLEMLREDANLPHDVQKALGQIDQQSERMRHLVDHLLELSKLEGNTLADNEGEPVYLASVIGTLCKSLQVDVPEHEFVVDANSDLYVLGAPQELYSLCENLMANAVRHAGAGARVEISWQSTPDGGAQFSVRDNGPGIEAHHLPRLSERFYRVDRGRSRNSGGTGLGLAIVKHVAHRHGGGLTIESTPGIGSWFKVQLPPARCHERRDEGHISAAG